MSGKGQSTLGVASEETENLREKGGAFMNPMIKNCGRGILRQKVSMAIAIAIGPPPVEKGLPAISTNVPLVWSIK